MKYKEQTRTRRIGIGEGGEKGGERRGEGEGRGGGASHPFGVVGC